MNPIPNRIGIPEHVTTVEMESLQFVGCSWFIGLIGLVSDSPKINLPKTEHVYNATPPLSLLDYT